MGGSPARMAGLGGGGGEGVMKQATLAGCLGRVALTSVSAHNAVGIKWDAAQVMLRI